MSLDVEFDRAVAAARTPRAIEVEGVRRLAYDVSGIPGASELPRALVVLLENCVRRAASDEEAARLARRVVEAGLAGEKGEQIEFMPARVLFQDFTGVPVFVDFAAMRDAMVERGGDPARVSPQIPCTLVVDHSVIADHVGCADAAELNERREAERNRERFAFLKWAASSFDNVRIVPPGEGICHQLNMERFCEVVGTDALAEGDVPVACFDTLVGTDSHTTTANGLGVLGWGVGGIEAEAAALGQPITMLVPPVVALRLTGRLRAGVSAMDLALTVGFAELYQLGIVIGDSVPGGITVEPLIVIAENDPFVTVAARGTQSEDAKAVDTALQQREAHHIRKAVTQALFIAQRLVDLVGGINEQRRSQLLVIGAFFVIGDLMGHGVVNLEDDVELVILGARLMVGDPQHPLVDKGEHLRLLFWWVSIGEADRIAVDRCRAEKIIIGAFAQKIEQVVDGDGIRIDRDLVPSRQHGFC